MRAPTSTTVSWLAAVLICATAHAEPTVAYQIDAAHNGTISFNKRFGPPLEQRWIRDLGGPVSYPLITHGMVFVTAKDADGNGAVVYGLNLETGNTVWSHQSDPMSGWSAPAYDDGQVYVMDLAGALNAFAADTGNPVWTTNLEGLFWSAPIAADGHVFLSGGDDSAAFSLNEATGAVEWTQSFASSVPAFADGAVFVTANCQANKFDPATGNLLWQYRLPCGGSGVSPVFFHHKLFVRSPSDVILDADTGALVGGFSSDTPPAVFQDESNKVRLIGLSGSQLYCTDVKTQNVLWSFSGDGHLTSNPIVINDMVAEGASSGELYILNKSTGELLWSTNVGAPIESSGEEQFGVPSTGLSAGQRLLLVPASHQLSAYEVVQMK